LFSTQISREWHMGHAARDFSRPGSDPRLLQLFIQSRSHLPPLTDGESDAWTCRQYRPFHYESAILLSITHRAVLLSVLARLDSPSVDKRVKAGDDVQEFFVESIVKFRARFHYSLKWCGRLSPSRFSDGTTPSSFLKRKGDIIITKAPWAKKPSITSPITTSQNRFDTNTAAKIAIVKRNVLILPRKLTNGSSLAFAGEGGDTRFDLHRF
jgi:hypothetical protein